MLAFLIGQPELGLEHGILYREAYYQASSWNPDLRLGFLLPEKQVLVGKSSLQLLVGS